MTKSCITCLHFKQQSDGPDCRPCINSGNARINWHPTAREPIPVIITPLIDAITGEPATLPTAPQLLTKAADIMAERGKQYDATEAQERSMGKAVRAFNAITGQNLSEPEGWLLLQVLKDVRLFNKPGYHQDSAEDCIAYAALKAEAKQHEA